MVKGETMHSLLFQRALIQFPVPMSGGSQCLVSLLLGDLNLWSPWVTEGLCRDSQHRYTHIKMIKKILVRIVITNNYM